MKSQDESDIIETLRKVRDWLYCDLLQSEISRASAGKAYDDISSILARIDGGRP